MYRDIKGRRENLAPLFIIGGIYDRKNPYFEDRVKINGDALETSTLEKIINSDEDIKNNTMVGYLEGTFANNSMIKESLKAIDVNEFFDRC